MEKLGKREPLGFGMRSERCALLKEDPGGVFSDAPLVVGLGGAIS